MGFVSGGCRYPDDYQSIFNNINMFPSGGKPQPLASEYEGYYENMRNKWHEKYEREKRERIKNFKFFERMFEGAEHPNGEDYGSRDNPLNDEVGAEYHIDYPFNVFGLKKSSSKEDMKKAYRKKVLETHPDKTGEDSEDEFRVIQEAYEYYTNYIL